MGEELKIEKLTKDPKTSNGHISSFHASNIQNLLLYRASGRGSFNHGLIILASEFINCGIPKLEDANDAGGKHSQECTLILTEGDSAKALAVASSQ